MPSQNARSAMLVGGAILAAIGGASLDTGSAQAQESSPLFSEGMLTSGVNFVDEPNLEPQPSVGFNVRDHAEPRFQNLNQFSPQQIAEGEQPRAMELELSAPHDLTGIPVDFSIAQRASFGAGEEGDINRHSRGAEVRVGALGDPDSGMSQDDSRVYMFAASDDEALVWHPGQENNRGFALQDRVEIGDIQAGVTYERGPMQASVAYIQREISANAGRSSFSDNENFAAFTFTMRN